jgi:hypothetical protein
MLHADAAGSSSLRAAASRLDSLLSVAELATLSTSRLAQQTIYAARVWEKLGDLPRALAMVGRYAVWSSENVPYLGRQLREQGRIAALAGNKKRAVRSYQHYLALRADAEPVVRPQIDSVRQELARAGGSRP